MTAPTVVVAGGTTVTITETNSTVSTPPPASTVAVADAGNTVQIAVGQSVTVTGPAGTTLTTTGPSATIDVIAAGPQGPQGSVVYRGTALPAAGNGNDGDWWLVTEYLDNTTNTRVYNNSGPDVFTVLRYRLYGPKGRDTAGVWPSDYQKMPGPEVIHSDIWTQLYQDQVAVPFTETFGPDPAIAAEHGTYVIGNVNAWFNNGYSNSPNWQLDTKFRPLDSLQIDAQFGSFDGLAGSDPWPFPWITSLAGSATAPFGKLVTDTVAGSGKAARIYLADTTSPSGNSTLNVFDWICSFTFSTVGQSYLALVAYADSFNGDNGTPVNGIAIILDPNASQIRVNQYASGTPTTLASATLAAGASNDYHLRIHCDGSTITVTPQGTNNLYNGTPVISVSAFVSPGIRGFAAWGGAVVTSVQWTIAIQEYGDIDGRPDSMLLVDWQGNRPDGKISEATNLRPFGGLLWPTIGISDQSSNYNITPSLLAAQGGWVKITQTTAGVRFNLVARGDTLGYDVNPGGITQYSRHFWLEHNGTAPFELGRLGPTRANVAVVHPGDIAEIVLAASDATIAGTADPIFELVSLTANRAGRAALIPLYAYPSFAGSPWDTFDTAAPNMVVANPNTGPGSSWNSDYGREIDSARAHGARVLGYVTTYGTANGNRALASIVADVNAWFDGWGDGASNQRYNIDGIFFDLTATTNPASDGGAALAAHKAFCRYVHGKRPWRPTVVANPGVPPLVRDYCEAADLTCIIEGDYTAVAALSGSPAYTAIVPATHYSWAVGYIADLGPSRFLHLIYNTPTVAATRLAARRKAAELGAGFAYFTDEANGNWTALDTAWSTQWTTADFGVDVHTAGDRHTGQNADSDPQEHTGRLVTPAYAATITPDLTAGSQLAVTLTGNVTIAAPINAVPGDRLTLVLTQDGTGGRTTTLNAVFKASWTPNTTAGKVNTITFLYDGTSWIQTSAVVGL